MTPNINFIFVAFAVNQLLISFVVSLAYLSLYCSGFYFDIKIRLNPIVDQVSRAATHGIYDASHLHDAVVSDLSIEQLNFFQQNMRKFIVLEIGKEVDTVVTELDAIADAARQFSEETDRFLYENGDTDAADIEERAEEFVALAYHLTQKTLVQVAQFAGTNAASEIPALQESEAAHFYNSVNQATQQILENAQWSEIENRLLSKIKTMLRETARLLESSNSSLSTIEDAKFSRSLSATLPHLVQSWPDFEDWVNEQIGVALNAASIHIENIRGFSEEVVNESLTLARNSLVDAVQYFQFYENQINPEILKKIRDFGGMDEAKAVVALDMLRERGVAE